MRNYSEYELQKAVCKYLDLAHKDVLYLTDTIASVKLTKLQGARNKAVQKAGFHCPDVLILEPKHGYCGLFIELKIESVFKKNGELKQAWVYDKKTKQKLYDHIAEQNKSIGKLNDKGYFACFSWGFDMTLEIIESYMRGENTFTPYTKEFYEKFGK